MSFDKIIEFTLDYEGGYVKDLADLGGETKYGISKRAYPHEDIAGMTIERATELYKRDYWDRLNIEDDVMHMVAFDTAVNIGVKRTTAFLNGCPSANDLITRREEYYNNLAIKRPSMKKFLRGWLNRTRALREFIKC